jgi:hypothetical protein
MVAVLVHSALSLSDVPRLQQQPWPSRCLDWRSACRLEPMSTERIFNIFVYFDSGGPAIEYGVYYHLMGGSDQEKTDYLLSRIDKDHPIARRFRFPRSFTSEEWFAVFRHGHQLEYFEEAFALLRAAAAPVFCITSVVDGTPTVDKEVGPEPYRGDAVTALEGRGALPDYLVDYANGDTFRFTDLIHDDYFKAIRTLFNTRLYVSCSKLLMSCVDTLAFVEYGDDHRNFTKWLDTYVDLTPNGISSDELWEFRNSILHMTNLASRKVVAGKVASIMPYVGGPETMPSTASNVPKPFNLSELIKSIGKGIGKWGEAYNTDRDKMLKFIERYDLMISDSRMVWVRHYKGGNSDATLPPS